MRTLKWEGGGSAAELEKNGQAFVICGGGGGSSKEAGGREKSREGDKDIIFQLK